MKPRDLSGNDFIAPCAWLAGLLFKDKFKRDANPKSTHDDNKIRRLSEDLYAVIIKHWKEWDE